MISHEDFYGGAVNSAVGFALNRKTPRVIRMTNATGASLTLPTTTLDERREGNLWFIVIAAGAGAVSLHRGLAVFGTVPSGQVGMVYLVDAAVPKWATRLRTIGTPRAFARGARAAVAEVDQPETFDPFCFVGDDCEYANANPLNGLEERPMVLAPFFQDPHVSVNQSREAVRAADVVMPDKIILRVLEDEFVPDPLHPLAATVLSEEFYEKLYNNNNPRILTYDETAAHGVSQNPHHVAFAGASGGPYSWTHPAMTVRRHVWSVDVPYSVGQTDYTMHMRFVMEHTVNPEPVAVDPNGASIAAATISQQASDNSLNFDPGPFGVGGFVTEGFAEGMRVSILGFTGGGYNGTATVASVTEQKMICSGATFVDDSDGEDVTVSALDGGANDADDGAWGAVFWVYIFTDELLPSWVEGGTHQPAGFSSAVAFTRNDPFVWGGLGGGGQEDKGAHPQMVIAACLPTTFQKPMGSNYVPPLQRSSFGGQRGMNRAYEYEVPNLAPWTPNPVTSCPQIGTSGALHNVVFGWTTGDTAGRAMTLGGDIPETTIPQHLCIENGLGVGRTYLQPLNPGWNEDDGTMVVDTSSMGIAICVTDPDWPKRLISPCHGHPAEPFEGIGGSHRCFKNAATGSQTQCCISLVDNAVATSRELCIANSIEYGEFNGIECVVEDAECDVARTYSTSHYLPVADYFMAAHANPDVREVEWLYLHPNPDQELHHYTYDPGDIGNLNKRRGDWDLGAVIEVTAVEVSGISRALLTYEPDGTYTDMENSVRALKLTEFSHGLGVRSGSGDDGYFLSVTPTGGGAALVELKLVQGGSEEVLDSAAIASGLVDEGDLFLGVWGTRLTASWEIGANIGSFTEHRCEIPSGGHPALLSEDPVEGAQFEDWVVIDTTLDLVEVSGSMFPGQVSVTFSTAAMRGHGKCTETTNPTCGECCDPPHCSCKITSYNMVRVSASLLVGNPGASDNPQHCGGPNPFQDVCEREPCSPGVEACDDCPPPSLLLSLCLTRCRDDGEEGDEPLMCSGVSEWVLATLNCQDDTDES